MTVDELLTWARNVSPVNALQKKAALAVLALLDVGFPCGWPVFLDVEFPCGWPVPTVVTDPHGEGQPYVLLLDEHELTPDEARGIAVALLRCAEEAESLE